MYIHFLVSEFSRCLHHHIEAATVNKSKIPGVNREASQAKFFSMMSTGMQDLTAITGNHQLTMWLCVNAVELLARSGPTYSAATATPPPTDEELDIVHYIGGFVVSKLKKRSRVSEYREVIETMISSSEPEPGTLLAVRSRGGLINLTQDGKSLFVELEQVFRELFPPLTLNIALSQFSRAVLSNQVVQDCFHNSTAGIDCSHKENVVSDIVALYFKVRVHHKCKTIIEKVRSKKRDATKEKALRSKLAK